MATRYRCLHAPSRERQGGPSGAAVRCGWLVGEELSTNAGSHKHKIVGIFSVDTMNFGCTRFHGRPLQTSPNWTDQSLLECSAPHLGYSGIYPNHFHKINLWWEKWIINHACLEWKDQQILVKFGVPTVVDLSTEGHRVAARLRCLLDALIHF